MSIVAQSADGTTHEFPDGTNPAVIDKVMKAYAVDKGQGAHAPAPAAQPQPGGMPWDNFHARQQAQFDAEAKLPLNDPITETRNAFSGGVNALKHATGDWFQHQPPLNSGNETLGALGQMIASPVTGVVNSLYVNPVAKVTGIPRSTVAGSLSAILPAEGAAAAPVLGAAGRLKAEGVHVLPGQNLGGVFKTAEEKATSAPILGDAIAGAAQRGKASLNQAFARRALAPVGETLPSGIRPGHDTIAHVQQVLGSKYDAAGKLIQNVQPDQQFGIDLSKIGDALKDYPKTVQEQFAEIVRNRVIDPLAGGSGSGDQFIGITSQIRKLASEYNGSDSMPGLSSALQKLHDSITDLGARQNPAYGEAKTQVDQGYATFKQLQRAGQAAGTKDGVATPAQLKAAVRNSDDSVDNGKFSAGKALNQDLIRDADQVMGGNYPDSGTSGRLAFNAMLLGGGHALAPQVTVPTAAALGAASLPYMAVGRTEGAANAFRAASRALEPITGSPIAMRAKNALPASIILSGAMAPNAFETANTPGQ